MTHGDFGGVVHHVHTPAVHHHHHTPAVHHHHHHSQSHHKHHSQSHHRHHSQSHHRHHSQSHHHRGIFPWGHHGRHGYHNRHHHHRHHCLPWDVLPVNYQYLQVVTANKVKVTKKPSRNRLVVVGGGTSPDLGRINVTMQRPPLRFGDVTYYEVQVHPQTPGRAPWRVLRRYNHFRALAAEPSVQSDMPLPPKLWTKRANRDPEQLEERRRALALWLQGAMESPATGPLAKFLLLGRCPLEPLEPESWEPSAPELEDVVCLLEVQVPEDLGPDDLMKVKVPGNEVITISLPWGLAPQSPLRLWWDPSNKTLAVHHCQDWQALRK